MNKAKKKKKFIVVIMAVALVVWAIFLFNIDIQTLVESVGIKNLYLILFVVSALSSTSFLTSASFYATFLAYINAGFDPLTVSIIAGTGGTIGDSIFFFVSRSVGDVMNNNKLYNKILTFISKLPKWEVYVFTYLYASFAPIPNDILVVTLGALKFKYLSTVPFLWIGNITLLFLIATGFYYAF